MAALPQARPPPSITITIMGLVLSLNIVNGLVFDSLMVAAPAELKLIAPGNTGAAISSALVFIGACVNLSSGPFGRLSDRYGRRPVLLGGSIVMTVASAILILAVRLAIPPRGDPAPTSPCGCASLPGSKVVGVTLFLVGYAVFILGLTMLNVMVSSLVSDFTAMRPTLISHISAAYYLLYYLGSFFGLLLGAVVIPPTRHDHGYFWFLLALMLLLVIAILLLPSDVLGINMVPPPDFGDDDPSRRLLLRKTLSHRLSALKAAAGDTARSVSDRSSGRSGSGRSSGRSSSLPASSKKVGAAGSSSDPPPARASRPNETLMSRGQLRSNALAAVSAKTHMVAMLCARDYRPFRMVVAGRTLFYCASGIFQTTALSYVSDHVSLGGAPALNISGMAAMLLVIVAVLAAAPIGKLNQKFGAVPCVAASTLVVAVLMFALPFVRDVALLLSFATLFGIAICLFCIADLALIVQTLPNDATSGTDMGVWNMFQHVGTALGASLCVPLLRAYSDDAPEYLRDDAWPPPPMTPPGAPSLPPLPPGALCGPDSCGVTQRNPVGLEGYRIIYFSAAGTALLSCVLIYLASAALRAAFLSEERSAERKDENVGTTIVNVRSSGDFTGSL